MMRISRFLGVLALLACSFVVSSAAADEPLNLHIGFDLSNRQDNPYKEHQIREPNWESDKYVYRLSDGTEVALGSGTPVIGVVATKDVWSGFTLHLGVGKFRKGGYGGGAGFKWSF